MAQPPYDGTPVAWSLTDTSQYKEIALDPAGHDIAVTRLQTEAAMAWIKGTDQVWGIRYDVKGGPDPLFSALPVQLTDGSAAGAAVSDIDIDMTGGLGFTAVWTSTTTDGDSTIHLRTGSTNTYVVLDPAAAVPGAGLTSGELTVRESPGQRIADCRPAGGARLRDRQRRERHDRVWLPCRVRAEEPGDRRQRRA